MTVSQSSRVKLYAFRQASTGGMPSSAWGGGEENKRQYSQQQLKTMLVFTCMSSRKGDIGNRIWGEGGDAEWESSGGHDQ